MSKVKFSVAALLIAAVAAVGAGWKWNRALKKPMGGGHSHLIAGWSWGDKANPGRGHPGQGG